MKNKTEVEKKCSGDSFPKVTFLSESEAEPVLELGLYISKMPYCFIYLSEGVPVIIATKRGREMELGRVLHFCQENVNPAKISEVSGLVVEIFRDRIPSDGYFASFPLLDSEGASKGALCVLNTAPNALDEQQKTVLTNLSRQLAQQIATKANLYASADTQAKIFQRAIFESERFFVMTTDTTGVVTSYNKGAEKILGYSAEEIVGKATIGLFIGEEGISARAEALSQEFNCHVEADGFSVALERAKIGLVDENEWTAVTKAGDKITVSVVGIALKGQYDELVGFLGIGTDVTQKKKAEMELVHSRNYFKRVINAIPHPLMVKDRGHHCIMVNDPWLAMTQSTRQEIEGMHTDDIYPPDFASISYEKDENAFKLNEKNATEELAFEYETAEGDTATFSALFYRTVFQNDLNEDFIAISVVDISERKEAENRLARSEQKLRALVENSLDHIVILEADGRIRYGSPSLFRSSGFDESEVLGRFCSDFIHEDDVERMVNTFKGAIDEKGALYRDEFRYRKSDGAWMSLEAVGKNALDDEAVHGVVLNLRDITERKRTEAELARTEQRYRAFVQNSSDFISILEADGTYRYQSPSFYDFTGYAEDEIIGKSTVEYIHPDYIENATKVFKAALREPGGSYRDEFLFKKADGAWVMLEVHGKNVLDDEIIKGVVVNCRDVTERKKIEEEIRIKSRMLQGITSNMPVIVFRVDKDGFFTESVGAGLKKIGFQENEVVGQKIEDMFPELAGEIRRASIGEAATALLESPDEANPWFYEFYSFPDKDKEAGGWIGFGLDVTDSKLHEETQKQYASTLEKINKELDQFAYVVSHDLKAPLRAINNLSEWIEEDLEATLNENEDVKSNMTLLRKRVKRMESLINGILEYSRAGRSEIEYENIEIGQLLDEVCSSIEIPESFTLDKVSMPVIAGSRLRLEQVFSNLISNAVKYHDKAAGNIKISYEQVGRFHQFSVADDGPGIEPEYHEKIFVIFQTLVSKDKMESTGVGLAIVKKIIEEQGGKIWVASSPGEGSKFTFTLPVEKINHV